MSETPHEPRPVLVPRHGGKIEVWQTTDFFDDEGRQYAESPDGQAKPLGSRTLSPEGQAALAEELAMSIDRTPEQLDRGEKLVENHVVEAMGEDALGLAGVESPDASGVGDTAKPEMTSAQRLRERLGGSLDIESPAETPEEKEKRIKKYTLESMGALLDGVARHANNVEFSGDPSDKRAFNQAMVSGVSELKARLDNELATPEGTAMMSGLFIGATTDFEATLAAFSNLEQSGRLADKDILELRQVLYDLQVIARNPQDAGYRRRIVGSLHERGDYLMSAKDANKKLGATYLGMAAGVAIGSQDHGIIQTQYEDLMRRLSQL